MAIVNTDKEKLQKNIRGNIMSNSLEENEKSLMDQNKNYKERKQEKTQLLGLRKSPRKRSIAKRNHEFIYDTEMEFQPKRIIKFEDFLNDNEEKNLIKTEITKLNGVKQHIMNEYKINEKESSYDSESTVSENESHNYECDECGEEGTLLLCDGCVRAYHKECLDPPLKRTPRGKWYCAICKEQDDTYNGENKIRNSLRFKSNNGNKKNYVEETSDESSISQSSETDDDSSQNSYIVDFDSKLESVSNDEINEIKDINEIKEINFDDNKKLRKNRKPCRVCKEHNNLIICPCCKSYFHIGCMLPPLLSEPLKGKKWVCFICETKRYSRPVENILFWRYIIMMPSERQLLQGAKNEPYKTRSFFVKFYDECFWKCRWVPETYLKYYHTSLYGIYKKKYLLENEPEVEYGFDEIDNENWMPNETFDFSNYDLDNQFYRFGVNPNWLQVEKIINETIKKCRKKYLIKWRDLGYEKCTWEYEDESYFKAFPENILEAITKFENHKKELKIRNTLINEIPIEYIAYNNQPKFLPKDFKLQHYQIHGVNWLRYSWHSKINTILADEMGLGKTIQTIIFIYSLYKEGKDIGPFLISAPLSTVPNWEREFSIWAPDLYVVTYIGTKDNRNIIYEEEFFNEFQKKTNTKYRFHVLLTSFEMIYVDSSILNNINWSLLVVDEAHRLKNSQSKYFKFLLKFKINYKLLLTGTPLQNTLEELYHLLLFLSPNDIVNKEEFLSRFEDISKEEQIIQLQQILGPKLLRRLKKDVLKDLPSKSESIIRVDMSNLQKTYYKAVLTKNYNQFVSKSSSSSLMNVVMELKKCCNHPYLFSSAFEEAKRDQDGNLDPEMFIQASGKFIILDKMLKKLKETNHRVLIFSQMTKMLDLLEDFLDYFDYKFERIDGSINSVKRQQAIDRFNSENSSAFCFLLSTRAGGFGINLATADTVFIFDSDWNPHNDIQAFSRAHRIGQHSKVMIYRFVTRNSVEERIIQVAKRKMMLTHLVVRSGSINSGEKSSVMTKRELDDILKFGTDELFKEDNEQDLKIVYDDKAIDDLLDRDKDNIEENNEGSIANDYFESFKVLNLNLFAQLKFKNFKCYIKCVIKDHMR